MFDPGSHPNRLALDVRLLFNLVVHFQRVTQGDSEVPFISRSYEYGQTNPLCHSTAGSLAYSRFLELFLLENGDKNCDSGLVTTYNTFLGKQFKCLYYI